MTPQIKNMQLKMINDKDVMSPIDPESKQNSGSP